MLICPMRDTPKSEGKCYSCMHGAPHQVQANEDCRIERCHLKDCICVQYSGDQWDK